MRGLSCFIILLKSAYLIDTTFMNYPKTQKEVNSSFKVFGITTPKGDTSLFISTSFPIWHLIEDKQVWENTVTKSSCWRCNASACQEFQTASGLVWRRKQRLAGIFHHLRLMSASSLLPPENGACNAAVVWGAPGAGKSCHSEDCVVCRQGHLPASITERPSLQSKACFLNDKALRVWNIYLVVANHLSWGKRNGRNGLYTILMVK